jgi:hypothetical protein
MDEQPDHEVGSVGEEAAKLLGALQDWARDSGLQVGPAAAAAEGLGARIRDVNEHIASGGKDCTFCPVCQAIAKVRETSPEVRGHLAVAASSLLQAAAGLLEARIPEAQRRDPGVQRIDLDDEDVPD